MLDRSIPLPLYFQLRSILQQEIESGALKPGDTVPTEQDLIERYKVSRITVRHALSSLAGEGFVYRQPGRGTFVRRNKIEQQLSGLTGFHEEMVLRGLVPGTRLISARMVDPEAYVATKLCAQLGRKALRMVRVRLANDEPIALDVVWCPEDLGQRLLKEDLGGALFEILEQKLGVEVDWADEVIQAVPADDTVASRLGIKKKVTILMVEQLVYAVDGRPVLFSKISYRADRYSYRITLKRKRARNYSHGFPAPLNSP